MPYGKRRDHYAAASAVRPEALRGLSPALALLTLRRRGAAPDKTFRALEAAWRRDREAVLRSLALGDLLPWPAFWFELGAATLVSTGIEYDPHLPRVVLTTPLPDPLPVGHDLEPYFDPEGDDHSA